MMHARIVAAIAHQQAADPSRDACHVMSVALASDLRLASSSIIREGQDLFIFFLYYIYILIYL